MKIPTLDELLEIERNLTDQYKANRHYMKAFYNHVPERPVSKNTATVQQEHSPVVKAVVKSVRKSKKHKGLTVPEKVKKSLILIVTGKTKDVANKMIEIYPEYQKNNKKALKDAGYHISALAKKGEIEIVEQGTGNSGGTYRIKQ